MSSERWEKRLLDVTAFGGGWLNAMRAVGASGVRVPLA